MLILDTCALLWLAQGSGLKPSVLKKIELSPVVYISAITGFEISLKSRKGKLELPVSPEKWFDIILNHHDISVVAADLDICIAANDLPFFHSDPCDRMIIATAQILKIPIVTADEKFRSYDVEIIF
ncbi:MAG: type II toxin-antitoxin system VapC family toxin [Desulfobacterales bacterium]